MLSSQVSLTQILILINSVFKILFTSLLNKNYLSAYFKLTYCAESEVLKVNIQKLKYLPDVVTNQGVVVK